MIRSSRYCRGDAVDTGRGIERVLQLHARYREAGGGDRVVDAERSLLESTGASG